MTKVPLLETGVDKLVSLIKEKKRISVPEAAKELGVSPIVVEEWANFLEEEDIINTNYKFATLWLIERKLTKKDVENRVKEFHGKKEILTRKAESLLSSIDREGEGFSRLKNEFKKIRQEISAEAGNVKKELRELEKYEKLKKNIDNQLKFQDQQFTTKIKDMDRQILIAQRKYVEILREIGIEEKTLRLDKLKTNSIKRVEDALNKKLKKIEISIEKVKQKTKLESLDVENVELHIKKLKELAENTKTTIVKQKNKMISLAKESKEHERRMLDSQKKILKKVFENSRMIKDDTREGEISSRKFKKFLEKRAEVDVLLDKIDTDRNNIKKELNHFISKAAAFSISSRSPDIEKQITMLEKKMKDIDRKKAFFEKEIRKLCTIVKKQYF